MYPFSRMQSRGSRFHSGGLGVEGVFARRCVRNPSQTVHEGSSAKVFTFGGLKRCATLLRVAGVALCDIATCFITCQKSSQHDS